MNIQHEADGPNGRFFYARDSAEAEITYRLKDSVVALDHTGVDERLEGKGVGKALVMRAAEWARESGYKMQPYCPFAATVLGRQKEYADLILPAEDEE